MLNVDAGRKWKRVLKWFKSADEGWQLNKSEHLSGRTELIALDNLDYFCQLWLVS